MICILNYLHLFLRYFSIYVVFFLIYLHSTKYYITNGVLSLLCRTVWPQSPLIPTTLAIVVVITTLQLLYPTLIACGLFVLSSFSRALCDRCDRQGGSLQ